MKFIVEDMLRGYVDAALWSSSDEDDTQFSRWASRSDIAASSIKSMKKDISKFVRANKNALVDYAEKIKVSYSADYSNPYEQAGHDLWLTRNGHGSGFWDRNYGGHDEIGKKLTAGAKKLGMSDLYRGDDGKIYVTPER
jgi:hypothetical protein